MKINNRHYVKFLLLLLLLFNCVWPLKTSDKMNMNLNMNLHMNMNMHYTFKKGITEPISQANGSDKVKTAQDSSDPINKNDNDLADLPLYDQGWLNYFHYFKSKTNSKPKSFYKNVLFEKQALDKAEIPDEVNLI